MKSFTEILAAVYDPGFWQVIDEWGDYCIFCGASAGRVWKGPGTIHHYGSCLLREIRAHLLVQACVKRRMSEAAVDCLPYPDYGSGGLSPTAAEAEAMPAAEVVPDHPPWRSGILDNCPEKSPLVEEIERIVDEVFAPGPKVPEVVPEAEVYRTARAEPEVVPEIKPELLHSWQSMTSGKAARCANCGLVALNGAPALGGVCPGRNPDLPAPAEVKAVTPAVPLIQVMCPRCHATETVPATGGVLPDLPQITLMSGPFMVVSWVHPAFGRQTGVYCKTCWSDATASFITATLPPAVICHPAQTSDPGPGQSA